MSLRSVVLLNDTAYVDGGGSQVAIASAMGLASRGLDVALVAASGPASPELQGRVRVRYTGQAKIAEDSDRRRAIAQGLWNFQAAAAVREVLAEYDPGATVVHAHGWTKALSSSALHVAVQSGFSVIVTLHDYFVTCPNGSYYDHRKERICTRRAMGATCLAANCDSRDYPTKLYRVARQFVQRYLGGVPRSIRHYIYVSDFSYRVLAPYLPKGARVYSVRNPIDMLCEAAVDAGKNEPFMYVGRLSPEKGVALLAAAAGKAQVPLVIVGDGDEHARIESINPTAHLTGWLSRDHVRETLKQARALVLPSLWYEVLGLVVLEAAALGVPAVVADTCAASELILHEQSGLVVRGGSLDALVDSLIRLRDPSLAQRLGSEAYRLYWEKPATLDAHVDALLSVYDKVLARDRSGARVASHDAGAKAPARASEHAAAW